MCGVITGVAVMLIHTAKCEQRSWSYTTTFNSEQGQKWRTALCSCTDAGAEIQIVSDVQLNFFLKQMFVKSDRELGERCPLTPSSGAARSHVTNHRLLTLRSSLWPTCMSESPLGCFLPPHCSSLPFEVKGERHTCRSVRAEEMADFH